MQAWHFDKGSIDGNDVTGRTIAAVYQRLAPKAEGGN
jgi:hypothetical protein